MFGQDVSFTELLEVGNPVERHALIDAKKWIDNMTKVPSLDTSDGFPVLACGYEMAVTSLFAWLLNRHDELKKIERTQ